MPKRTDIKTILIIGAGPIVIGQACEFDYSGTQGIKALKEEGYRVVLINSNPATIMTDKSLADAVYIEPITPEFIEQIIVIEEPDAILPTLGGQTALNAALKLEELGILKKYNVQLIGVSIEAIKKAEDRGLFKEAMKKIKIKDWNGKEIGLEAPPSIIVSNFEHGFDNLLYNICAFLRMMFISHVIGNKNFEKIVFTGTIQEIENLRNILSTEKSNSLSQYLNSLKELKETVENLPQEIGEAFQKRNYDIEGFKESVEKVKEKLTFFETEFDRLSQKHNNQYINLPVIIRPSLTLGGTGGGVAENLTDYIRLVKSGLEASPIGQIQIDQSIIGWKEYEMEVVRDKNDNAIIICSIENVDPMGVHTGDSITVAPALTLTDKEYQKMRDYSIAVLREIGVETGGSNVQFAVNPANGEMLIIEMNPRVSRSSALASKATGFPIAKVAAKLAVGYTLDELKNDISSTIPKEFDYLEYRGVLEGSLKNDKIEEYIADELIKGFSLFDLKQRALPASFEPSIDYIVVKIPKFNFEKFNTLTPELGTQMQSVGEVMAMGRSFEEAFLKAVSGMEEEREDLSFLKMEQIFDYLKVRSPKRIYYILQAFREYYNSKETTENDFIDRLIKTTGYDKWFLERLQNIILIEREIAFINIPAGIRERVSNFIKLGHKTQSEVALGIKENKDLFEALSKIITKELVFKWKKAGFRDGEIRRLLGLPAGISGVHIFKEYRKFLGVVPVFKKIDSCAGEFASKTNYFYSTYEESMENEALASGKKKIVIIGSGPNRVGQGIEFDYACVHAAFALKDLEIESIMINCNPETVSTDYDTSNRLFFEPLTDEHVMNVIENEIQNGDLLGVIVQFGGQTPLKLRKTLKAAGVKILGMTKDAIDICDDRASFSGLVKQVGAREAESFKYSNREELEKISRDLNFKFIIRPSAVIGGRGMAIIESESELLHYMESEKIIPIGILNPLLEKSIELDIDLLRDKNGSIFIFGFLEHIEFVGVHSGDSSCSVQARLISASAKANIEKIACNFANTLGVTGLINIQVAVKGEEIFIIEVNPRASRTVPFTAKSINFPAIKIAVKLMCGQLLEEQSEFKNYNLKQSKDGYYILKDLGYSCIKEPVFSFEKFLQSDIVRGPEMKSLGEVMGIGASFGEAFAKALIASGQKLDFIKQISGTAFISVKEPDKNEELIDICANLIKLDFTIVATKGTAQFLSLHGVPCTFVNKVHEGGEHIVDLINNNKINFVINTTSGFKSLQDSFLIRRSILRNKILHSTTIEGGKAIIEAITAKKNKNLTVFKL